MPSRYIREGIIESDAVNRLSFPAEVFYRRLMSVVDDYGYFDGRIPIIRGRLYALQADRVSESDVSGWLDECERENLVFRYSVNGKPYVFYAKLGEARAGKAKFPGPPPELRERWQMGTCGNDGSESGTVVPDSEQKFQMASVTYYDQRTTTNDQRPEDAAATAAPAATGTTPARKSPRAAADVPIPMMLDTPEFREAWGHWMQDRADRRKKMTVRAAELALKKLAPYGSASAIAAIERAIEKGWEGLYPENPGNSTGPPHRQPYQNKRDADAAYAATQLQHVLEAEAELDRQADPTPTPRQGILE